MAPSSLVWLDLGVSCCARLVYSVLVALLPGCVAVLLRELATVVIPHRNQPGGSVPVVCPQLASLAASASDWACPWAAPPLFDASGPSQMKPENWREVCVFTQCKGWNTKQTHKQDRCSSGTGLESPVSDSALSLPAPADRDRGRDGDRDRDRDRDSAWRCSHDLGGQERDHERRLFVRSGLLCLRSNLLCCACSLRMMLLRAGRLVVRR